MHSIMKIIFCMKKPTLLLLFFLYAMNLSAQQKDSLEEVSIAELKSDKHTMIALTFGQSNAGNRGQKRYTSHNANVLAYADGKLYHAKDPLPGATGPGGSVWSVLGDLLIDSGLFKKVIFIPIAIGNTAIDCWAHGDCYRKLEKTLLQLDSAKVQLTHIFWHQGESDNLNNTSKQQYKNDLAILLKTFRDHKQKACFYISIASYHNEAITKPLGIDTVIEKAQKEFIKENKGVLQGPDTDELIYAIHRWDAVHFSEYGMKVFAARWLRAIRNRRE